MKRKTQVEQRGFSLIELLIAMAVVLVLVAGLAIGGERALEGSRESSALSSVQSYLGNQAVYQRNWGGFSALAADLGGAGTPAAAICTADQELASTATYPASMDTGLVQAGYTLKYLAGGTAFAGNAGCEVNPSYEFTATPVDGKTKSFCGDSTAIVYLPPGATMTNTGAGCLTDNTAALPIGQ